MFTSFYNLQKVGDVIEVFFVYFNTVKKCVFQVGVVFARAGQRLRGPASNLFGVLVLIKSVSDAPQRGQSLSVFIFRMGVRRDFAKGICPCVWNRKGVTGFARPHTGAAEGAKSHLSSSFLLFASVCFFFPGRAEHLHGFAQKLFCLNPSSLFSMSVHK